MAPAASLTVFRSSFLTLKSAALGRLVPDATNPGQEFWPISTPKLDEALVDVGDFEGVIDSSGSGRHAGVWTKLCRFMSLNLSSTVASSDEFNTSALKRYTLTHPTIHFRSLCEDKDTKMWIETTVEHSAIFLIVGLITVKAAAISHRVHKRTDAAAEAEISATDILTGGASAAILPVVGLDALSLGVGGSIGSSKDEKRSFVAPDERVIGIQYRKLKFGMFSKRKVDKGFLENNPNRWVTFLGGNRSAASDILEADLQDSMSADDLELDYDDEEIDVDGELVFVKDGEEDEEI